MADDMSFDLRPDSRDGWLVTAQRGETAAEYRFDRSAVERIVRTLPQYDLSAPPAVQVTRFLAGTGSAPDDVKGVLIAAAEPIIRRWFEEYDPHAK